MIPETQEALMAFSSVEKSCLCHVKDLKTAFFLHLLFGFVQ